MRPNEDVIMVKKTGKSLAEARQANKARLLSYRSEVCHGVGKFDVGDEEKKMLLAFLGVGGRSERLLWSDALAAYVASKRLAAMMQAHYMRNPNQSLWLATFKDECGIASDRVPYVRIREITDKIRRAVAILKAHAFVVIEVHPLMNHPGGGAGRTLLFHAHAILWSDGDFDGDGAMKLLNSSRAWSNSLIADPVHIIPIGDTREDIERVTLYMMKRPHSAKNRMPDNKRPGKFILMDTTAGYRDEFALRVFEGLSQIELMDTIFGVGDGRAIRQRLSTDMRNWHRARGSEGVLVPATTDIWDAWRRMRLVAGSKNYAPYRFDWTPAAKPLPKERAKPSRRPRKRIKKHSPTVLRRSRRRAAWRRKN